MKPADKLRNRIGYDAQVERLFDSIPDLLDECEDVLSREIAFAESRHDDPAEAKKLLAKLRGEA